MDKVKGVTVPTAPARIIGAIVILGIRRRDGDMTVGEQHFCLLVAYFSWHLEGASFYF